LKFTQRDAGAIDAQFLWRTAQMNQPISERLGTREHEWNRTKKTPQFCRIILDLGFVRNVSAMERDHAWLVPLLDKRKQVHAGMAKIDMHKIGAVPLQ
jgi:hypothetical protein